MSHRLQPRAAGLGLVGAEAFVIAARGEVALAWIAAPLLAFLLCLVPMWTWKGLAGTAERAALGPLGCGWSLGALTPVLVMYRLTSADERGLWLVIGPFVLCGLATGVASAWRDGGREGLAHVGHFALFLLVLGSLAVRL